MIAVFLLISLLSFLCNRMGSLLRKKGWKPLVMQILVVVTWFVFQGLGGMVHGVYMATKMGEEAVEQIGYEEYMEQLGFSIYVWAVLSGFIGMILIFGIAKLLPHRLKKQEPPPLPINHGG